MKRTTGWFLLSVVALFAPFTGLARDVVLCISSGPTGHVALEFGPCQEPESRGEHPLSPGPGIEGDHEECVPCVDVSLGTERQPVTVRSADTTGPVPFGTTAQVNLLSLPGANEATTRIRPAPRASPQAPLALRI